MSEDRETKEGSVCDKCEDETEDEDDSEGEESCFVNEKRLKSILKGERNMTPTDMWEIFQEFERELLDFSYYSKEIHKKFLDIKCVNEKTGKNYETKEPGVDSPVPINCFFAYQSTRDLLEHFSVGVEMFRDNVFVRHERKSLEPVPTDKVLYHIYVGEGNEKCFSGDLTITARGIFFDFKVSNVYTDKTASKYIVTYVTNRYGYRIQVQKEERIRQPVATVKFEV